MNVTSVNKKVEKVCVVGNLNIDLIIRNVPHLPEWGQEVSGEGHVAVSSGQAGYLALALSNLDIPTSVIGNVGEDTFGEQILHDLEASGTDTSAVEVIRNGKTGITVAIAHFDGERAFVSDFAHLREFDLPLITRHWDQVENADLICLVGTFCLPHFSLETVRDFLRKVHMMGKITMLDTGWDPENWPPKTIQEIRESLQYVTLFMPNMDEARIITGIDDPKEAAHALKEDGVEFVVIKLGPQGSLAVTGTETQHFPALKTQVYDTVGAGDVFDAGFLFGLRKDWRIEDCLAFGNAAASIYISRENDRYPKAHEAATRSGLTKLLSI